jgi:hypothetical protein
MKGSVQRFLAHHAVPAREAVEQDVAPYRSMTPAERALHLDAACRLAAEALAASPWRERILARREPPHAGWVELIRRTRRD